MGLLVNVNSEWIAGAYYLLNLVQALKTLNQNHQPEVVVLSENKDAYEFIRTSGYSKLKFRPLVKKRTYFEAVVNKFYQLFGLEYTTTYPSDSEVDLVFPATQSGKLEWISKKVYWIPDFQHHHYPEYFSKEEIKERDKYFSFIGDQRSDLLVLSSHSACNDFNTFYPNATVHVTVIPFAVTLPEYQHLSLEIIKAKYHIRGEYFIVPNQFWKHKNHLLVFEAINELKEAISNLQFVFTGGQNDYRNPDYFQEIQKFVSENKLEDLVCFTGFIDRAEQLLLMKNSVAVIQPSLFEGWSTVVEDVKALNHKIILSDILVHREQYSIDESFFDPSNFSSLALGIKSALEGQIQEYSRDYKEDIIKYGEAFSQKILSI